MDAHRTKRQRIPFAVPATSASVVCLVLLYGSAKADDPFKIRPERFRDEVAVVALEPVRVVAKIAAADEVAQKFGELARHKLETDGYRVVDPAVVEAQWIAMSKKVGGVFDPVTGAVDEKKL